jgi:hypothetical protein
MDIKITALGKYDKQYTWTALQLIRELLGINGLKQRVEGAFGK